MYNYNGLSEWQHMNGLCAAEGNATLHNSTYNDMWSQESRQQQRQPSLRTNQIRSNQGANPYIQQNAGARDYVSQNEDYLFRES